MSDQDAERPATFREVFSSSEYRSVFLASALSWVGDFVAKAAVTALVYNQTRSVVASAAAFAISFLPWVAGGPVLAAIAERYPQRTTMIVSDLCRAALVALVAIPWMPIPAMLALLFLTGLLNPPFDAARSALLPRILSGDRYVVGLSVQNSANQAAQLIGYMVGAALAARHPHGALLIDAGTFGFSAFVIWSGIRTRPPVSIQEPHRHLLRETAQGFRLVFGTPTLRAIAVLVLTAYLFTTAPEGLAAAWAGSLEPDPSRRGLAQGIIMIGNPLGFLIAGLVVGRLVPPATRQRLIRPFCILAPATLVPALFKPNAIIVAILAGLCGVCLASMVPAANGLFVQVLPNGYRARAFGIMQSGLQISQGGGVMLTGLLAAKYSLSLVVGAWSAFGVVLLLSISTLWPSPAEFSGAIARTRAANAAAEAAALATQSSSPISQRQAAGDQHPTTVSRPAEST
ncbi:MFS transporter [Rugosimonospora africana]|uniref:MFS transporter n=1 Tax=Rugosimonospora africana TaxID=556532 RepID=A0A8J3QZN3_9ACTN|nr:MFS transporter [Rugosimonospora africana]GIH20239.1 MFS transporter [Rugosimonospora africana]